jgi:hypothetical protein
MNYFSVWYALALIAVLFFGFETRGRTIEEINRELAAAAAKPGSVRASGG